MITSGKLLLLLAIAGGAYGVMRQQRSKASEATAESAQGFVQLPAVPGHGNGTEVIVFAAKNCPLEDSQRAESLAAALRAAGIPVRQTNDISFTSSDPSDFPKVDRVMRGRLPIVLVNGKARNDPSLEDVLTEYRAGR
jgi:hypothetical protein